MTRIAITRIIRTIRIGIKERLYITRRLKIKRRDPIATAAAFLKNALIILAKLRTIVYL